MDEKQEIRPLTREEQLQWLIPFLESQIINLQKDLEIAKNELAEIQQPKQLTLTKIDKNKK